MLKNQNCECWPYEEGLEHVCFAYDQDSPMSRQNVVAPGHVTIKNEEPFDGSVVRVSFKGEEKTQVLRVGNYGAFLDGVGCGAATPVSYRVYVRCLGCVTQRTDFHTKDGAQFTGPMWMGERKDESLEEYTYEAWFRSPLEGKFRRELFGGHTSGLVLMNENVHSCRHLDDGNTEETTYQLHAGNTNAYSNVCFKKGLMYHVAVTKNKAGTVLIYVNGEDATATHGVEDSASKLAYSFGGGFTDGGQLLNVRIWKYARTQPQIVDNAAVFDKDLMDFDEGLRHWWPLTESIQDVITGSPLGGPEVRYSPVWCSDLEATGMRVC